MTDTTWRKGDPVLIDPAFIVDAAGVVSRNRPELHPGFLAELHRAAMIQMSMAMIEAWLRLDTGALSALVAEYPEILDTIKRGEQYGLEELREACRRSLAKAATPAGRRDKRLQRHAADLRQMKRAGMF